MKNKSTIYFVNLLLFLSFLVSCNKEDYVVHDGALYISNTGFGPPTGEIIKVEFN